MLIIQINFYFDHKAVRSNVTKLFFLNLMNKLKITIFTSKKSSHERIFANFRYVIIILLETFPQSRRLKEWRELILDKQYKLGDIKYVRLTTKRISISLICLAIFQWGLQFLQTMQDIRSLSSLPHIHSKLRPYLECPWYGLKNLDNENLA